jgi:hypothetical protein
MNLNWLTTTMVGKIFVMVQFVLSMILLAVIAIGIYPHRNNPNMAIDHGTGKMQSTIQRYDEQLKDLAGARDRAEARWLEGYQALSFLEQLRPQRQQSYAEKLTIARTGKDSTGKAVQPPVTALAFDQNGLAQLTGGKAIQNRGEDLKSYDEMVNILRDYHRSEPPMLGLIPQRQAEIKNLIRDFDALSEEILGNAMGLRGLRKERELQEELKAKTIAQQEYLKPFLANYYSETVLLLKRQNSLLNRKQELGKVASGGRTEK